MLTAATLALLCLSSLQDHDRTPAVWSANAFDDPDMMRKAVQGVKVIPVEWLPTSAPRASAVLFLADRTLAKRASKQDVPYPCRIAIAWFEKELLDDSGELWARSLESFRVFALAGGDLETPMPKNYPSRGVPEGYTAFAIVESFDRKKALQLKALIDLSKPARGRGLTCNYSQDAEHSFAAAVHQKDYPAATGLIAKGLPASSYVLNAAVEDPCVFELLLIRHPESTKWRFANEQPLSIRIAMTLFVGRGRSPHEEQRAKDFIQKCRAYVLAGGNLSDPASYDMPSIGLKKGDQIGIFLADVPREIAAEFEWLVSLRSQ